MTSGEILEVEDEIESILDEVNEKLNTLTIHTNPNHHHPQAWLTLRVLALRCLRHAFWMTLAARCSFSRSMRLDISSRSFLK